MNEEEKEAYNMGYEVGKGVAETTQTIPEITSPEEAYSNFEENEVQSANYSNFTLPELRRIAGCKDLGYGTYTICSEEQTTVYHELVDRYWEGVYQGIVDNWKKR